MKSRDFVFWLQGFFELNEPESDPKGLTPYQVKMIKAHLSLVFQHDADIAAKPHPAPSPAPVGPTAWQTFQPAPNAAQAGPLTYIC